MNEGKKRLEKVLGSIAYKNITQELKKDHFSDGDFLDLAKHLGLQDFYQELKERQHVGFKNYSELLLIRWATLHPERVSKENLSHVFQRTSNLKGLAKLVDYVYFPKLRSCCNPESTSPTLLSPRSPTQQTSFFTNQNIPENKVNPSPFIHMSLKNGRQSANELLEDKKNGSYLVRPSSQQESYAISLKMENTVQHILVETVLTGTGVKVSLNTPEKKYFNSLKGLLDSYHVEEICGSYKLENIILPQQTGQGQVRQTEDHEKCVKVVEGDINPVFVDKFCEEIENSLNLGLEQDIADRLELGQQFGFYKCSFRGINTSRSHRARWILDMWMQAEGEKATIEKLENAVSRLRDGKKIFKKCKQFSKPW